MRALRPIRPIALPIGAWHMPMETHYGVLVDIGCGPGAAVAASVRLRAASLGSTGST